MWGAIAGGALGALAGGLGKKSSQTSQVHLAPESQLEKDSGAMLQSSLGQLQGLVGAGPGQGDVEAGLSAQRGLASLLQQFSQGGFLPGQQDFQQAQQFTNSVFAPQQQQMSQQFADEDLELQRLAARTGRNVNDPVLRNKLAQTRGNLQSQLGAQQTSFMSQFAQQMPQQRLGYAQQFAQVQGGLASQAMANRQALLSMGSGIRQQEQQFRLGSASRTLSGSEGGGLGGAIAGGMAGFGAGAGQQQNLNTMMGQIGGGLSQAGSWLAKQFAPTPQAAGGFGGAGGGPNQIMARPSAF
jgi:hypothetical protein